MTFRRGFIAWLKAHGQIVLSDCALPGLLVLVAIALVSPFGALGAMIGALAGTLFGWFSSDRDDAAWDAGIYGVNPAILGIMWAGPLSRADATASLFVLALAAALLADNPIRSRLYKLGLPALSVNAVLVGWCSHWVFQIFDAPFWPQEGFMPFGAAGVGGAVLLVAVAIAWDYLYAAILAAGFAAMAAMVTAAMWGQSFGSPGLWAFSVVPAVVIPFAFLGRRPQVAVKSGFIAALVATAIWWVWVVPEAAIIPPLLAPAILGAWIGIRVVTRKGGQRVLDPEIWHAVDAIEDSIRQGKPIAALTGAGVSTASGIPDYMSGAWFDPRVPVTNYGFDVFKASRKCRIAYWEACARFRHLADAVEPGLAHIALAQLQRDGILSAVVTQNVDGLHQSSGSPNVVELHGNIDSKRCLKCHRVSPWEEDVNWKDDDVACPSCGGLIKPAVIAFGEDIPPKAWREASEAVKECGVLLVAGTQLTVSSAAQLLGIARRNDARVIFVNDGPVSQPVLDGDVFLHGRAEAILPAIHWLLTHAKHPPENSRHTELAKANGA